MNIANWNWAVWTLIAFQVLALCIGFGMHGKDKDGKHNAGVSLFAFILGAILYYYAGIYQ